MLTDVNIDPAGNVWAANNWNDPRAAALPNPPSRPSTASPPGNVTSIPWQKPDAEALHSDILLYTFTVHLKTPDKPLTTLYFPVHQTCRAANGTLSNRASVCASRVLPEPVGPISRMLLLASSISSFFPRFLRRL